MEKRNKAQSNPYLHKLKLTNKPPKHVKSSGHSPLLMQRIKELDREFVRQTKELKQVSKEIAKDLPKRPHRKQE